MQHNEQRYWLHTLLSICLPRESQLEYAPMREATMALAGPGRLR